jgi:hypothetical protein
MKTLTLFRVLFGFALLLSILSDKKCFGQKRDNCGEIEVDVKVVNATAANQNDGSIELVFAENTSRYKVFLLSEGAERAKEELKTRKVENIKHGFYEFIIIDTSIKGCFKELLVKVNSAK